MLAALGWEGGAAASAKDDLSPLSLRFAPAPCPPHLPGRAVGPRRRVGMVGRRLAWTDDAEVREQRPGHRPRLGG